MYFATIAAHSVETIDTVIADDSNSEDQLLSDGLIKGLLRKPALGHQSRQPARAARMTQLQEQGFFGRCVDIYDSYNSSDNLFQDDTLVPSATEELDEKN